AGDTALADETIAAIRSDLVRIVAVVLAVNLALLAIFLRALVAPVLLVFSSAISVAAALGITTLVFQSRLGYDALTAYVPFAFGEFAFAMAVGILLETFVVRPLLVPALVALFGELAGWPGSALRRPGPAVADGD